MDHFRIMSINFLKNILAFFPYHFLKKKPWVSLILCQFTGRLACFPKQQIGQCQPEIRALVYYEVHQSGTFGNRIWILHDMGKGSVKVS